MFTVEKTLRRTLRQIVVSAGFASKYADKIVGNLRGLDALIIPAADWKLFKDAAEMRNKMVHGERVYELETCRKEAENVLAALDRLKKDFDSRYGYSGGQLFRPELKAGCMLTLKSRLSHNGKFKAALSSRGRANATRSSNGVVIGTRYCH